MFDIIANLLINLTQNIAILICPIRRGTRGASRRHFPYKPQGQSPVAKTIPRHLREGEPGPSYITLHFILLSVRGTERYFISWSPPLMIFDSG